MILHTINKTSAYQKCRSLLLQGDIVVLLEDGVLLLMDKDFLACDAKILILDNDINARGLMAYVESARIARVEGARVEGARVEGARVEGSHLDVISYSDFVCLSVDADKICNWY